MERLGVAFITIGLALAVLAMARLWWMIFFDPTVNDAFLGFLYMASMWGGAILAAVGAVFVIKHRGKWTPPL
jgi:hypothetical protein